MLATRSPHQLLSSQHIARCVLAAVFATVCAASLSAVVVAHGAEPPGGSPQSESAPQVWRVTVAAADAAPREQIAHAVLRDRNVDPAALRVVELIEDQARWVPSQVDLSAETPRVWWIMPADPSRRTTRTFRLETGPAPPSPALSIDQTRGALVVRAGEHRVLQYNAAHVNPPEGVHPNFGRSAHIHPAWTPSGRVASDEFPPDHLHQSGVFLAYTKTEFAGRTPNFWELLGGSGRVRHKQLHILVSGPVFAQFEVEHEHVDLSGPREHVALAERWRVRVWNVGGPDAGYWRWEIHSTQRCASELPLKLPTYHYGGMALRGAREWKGEMATFLTAEGKHRQDGNHSRPRWCDLSGPIEGQTAGLALLTHPRNFRFPEPLRIHPSMPYMVYTPSQLGAWEITPDRPQVASYGFILHDGALSSDTLNQLWQDFAQPLEAVAVP